MPSIGFCSCSDSHPRGHPLASRDRVVRGALGRIRCDLEQQVGQVGQELVQRRVEQPDRDRQPLHRLKNALEVVLLQRQQLVERDLALLAGRGHDHLLHDRQPVLAEEHVLGAAQADALGAELAGLGRVLRACRRWPAPAAGAPRRPSR